MIQKMVIQPESCNRRASNVFTSLVSGKVKLLLPALVTPAFTGVSTNFSCMLDRGWTIGNYCTNANSLLLKNSSVHVECM